MKNYVRSALDTLTALGFQVDHQDRELRTDRWRFTHANEAETVLTLNFKMSEQAARTVVQRAKQIVGLGTSEVDVKPKARANHRAKQDREAERKRIEAARALLAAKDAEARTRRIEAATARNHQELDRLLRGVAPTAPTADAVAPDSMLTVEEVADQTGLTDKAVLRAVESGRLEAYRCGAQVKVKGADVRAWLGRST